jgi:hypothetical protein
MVMDHKKCLILAVPTSRYLTMQDLKRAKDKEIWFLWKWSTMRNPAARSFI